MARLPYPDPDELGEAERKALERLPELNVFRMLAHAQTAFRPYLRFGGALLTELELDPVLRELAILQTARSAQAEYEWIQHVSLGRTVGVTAAQIAALERDDPGDAAFDAPQRAVVRFAAAVVRSPRPAGGELEAVREHLSDRQVVELLLVIGSYTMIGRLMTVLEIDLDDSLGAEVLDSASGRGWPR